MNTAKKKQSPITHTQCVNISAVWLSNQKTMSDYRVKIVLTEMVGYASMTLNSELPDVLGIWGNASTVNIECKVSRSDFLNDKKKYHDHPYGNYKLYACPTGMISPEEIPEAWGLIYINKVGGKLIKNAQYHENCHDVVPMLSDLILNGATAGALRSEHKKRTNRMWDGKAVIL